MWSDGGSRPPALIQEAGNRTWHIRVLLFRILFFDKKGGKDRNREYQVCFYRETNVAYCEKPLEEVKSTVLQGFPLIQMCYMIDDRVCRTSAKHDCNCELFLLFKKKIIVAFQDFKEASLPPLLPSYVINCQLVVWHNPSFYLGSAAS